MTGFQLMSAKVHTHGSNREQPNQTEKKVVFKGVLDNPFRIHWYQLLYNRISQCVNSFCRPSVPVNLQNLVLAQILSLLDGVSQYQLARSQANRKRKREQSEKSRPRKKKRVNDSETPPSESGSGAAYSTKMQTDLVIPDQPAILAHLITGINEVTKCLETQVRNRRARTTDENFSSPPNVKIVLVCRADINPPMLIDHLPHLVAAYNSAKATDPLLLVPLPQGAEYTLAQVMGVRRVAVMAINVRLSLSLLVSYVHY